jgi:ubiquinone/menaquinone biosynthesis C-methylase UbiE
MVARAAAPEALMYRRDAKGVELAAISAVVQLDGQRVVDVGCGTGRLTRFAAQRADWVYAFDPDPDSVEQARASLSAELGRRVSFGVHSADALDVPRRRFDTALCGWYL